MKPRSVKDIEKTLLKKGFQKLSSNKKTHHSFYYFIHRGRKTSINTYLSHGAKSKEYSSGLMNKIQHQLKFVDSNLAESFLDCPFKEDQYVDMLQKNGELD